MIKRLPLAAVLIAATIGLSAAGTQKRADDFNSFWGKFKTAVIKGNKPAVASMTKFPLSMSYGIRSVKNRADLFRRYREVFSQQSDAAKCFASKGPEQDINDSNRWSVACPDEAGNEVVIYQFARGRLGWRFVGLDNINE